MEARMKRLNWIWKKWQTFGRALGDILGRIVLTIFYFTIFLPFGVIMRFFNDPLALKANQKKGWRDRVTGDQTLEEAGRLF